AAYGIEADRHTIDTLIVLLKEGEVSFSVVRQPLRGHSAAATDITQKIIARIKNILHIGGDYRQVRITTIGTVNTDAFVIPSLKSFGFAGKHCAKSGFNQPIGCSFIPDTIQLDLCNIIFNGPAAPQHNVRAAVFFTEKILYASRRLISRVRWIKISDAVQFLLPRIDRGICRLKFAGYRKDGIVHLKPDAVGVTNQ